MSREKKPPAGPLFEQMPDGTDPGRCEIWRLSPAGPALVCEGEASWTASDLVQAVRESDHAYGLAGGRYQARIRSSGGTFSHYGATTVVDRHPDYRPANAGAATPTDPALSILPTIVGILDASNKSFLERMRAESAEREKEHARALDRQRTEEAAARERERAQWHEARERDRELADQARDRDRQFFGFITNLTRQRPSGLQELLLGMKIAERYSDREGSGDESADLITSIAKKFGGRFIEEDDAPRKKKRGAAADADTEPVPDGVKPSEFEKFRDLLNTLIATADRAAVAGVLASYVKAGRLHRQVLAELASGKLDKDLQFPRELLDKLRGAAQDALNATSGGNANGAAPGAAPPKPPPRSS